MPSEDIADPPPYTYFLISFSLLVDILNITKYCQNTFKYVENMACTNSTPKNIEGK